MSEKKSLVEEALLQMKNLEQVVTENAKGILASTMKEEIEELVKESLEEADTYAENESYSNEDVTEDEEEDSLMAMDMKAPMMGGDMMSDDSDSMKMDDMGLEDDDDDDELEPLDMTGASMEEIMAVLNGMGDNDGVIIKKTGEDLDVDKITFQDDEMESLGESYDDADGDTNESVDEEIVYEIELGEDDNVDEDDYSVTESSMMVKPKGLGMGKVKSELPTGKVNMKGFKEDMSQHKESFKGPKKFEFKEGEDADVEPKETETKEASRTYGNGSRNFPKRKGLPKMKVITNSALQEEVENLRAKNEEYRKALNIFREKLNEVAVFNSNLAYATRLFTEHTTTKSEKINIMRRFDNVETIKESKNLYQTIKEELGSVEKPMVKESIVENIDRTPSKGSTNLVESKTYENPQFLRMKDIMSKIVK